MKATIKKLAIKVGKKLLAAVVAAVELMIGEFILGLFGKGFNKFKAAKLAKKNATNTEPIVDTTVEETTTKTDATETTTVEETETSTPDEN